MVWDVARTWANDRRSDGSWMEGARWILLIQEFGEFAEQILMENARHPGYDTYYGCIHIQGRFVAGQAAIITTTKVASIRSHGMR